MDEIHHPVITRGSLTRRTLIVGGCLSMFIPGQISLFVNELLGKSQPIPEASQRVLNQIFAHAHTLSQNPLSGDMDDINKLLKELHRSVPPNCQFSPDDGEKMCTSTGTFCDMPHATLRGSEVSTFFARVITRILTENHTSIIRTWFRHEPREGLSVPSSTIFPYLECIREFGTAEERGTWHATLTSPNYGKIADELSITFDEGHLFHYFIDSPPDIFDK